MKATAEVFWTAFHHLPKSERAAVVERLLQDPEFREDLIDIALINQRRDEPSRPLSEYLAERPKKLGELHCST